MATHLPGGRVMAPSAPVWRRAIFIGFVVGFGYWLGETSLHAFVFHTGNFAHELLHGDSNELWMRGCTALLFGVLGGGVQWHLARAAAWSLHVRRLASAVEQAGEGIVITDAQGQIEFINPAFSRLTGYSLDEVRGRNPSVLKSGAHSPDHYQAVWAAITGGRVWSGSVVDKRKDGSYYPALLTIAPVADGHGFISHFVGVQHDLSRQVELEERVRHVEKVETLGVFAAGIAHDFGNMLAIQALQLQLARMHLDAGTGDVRADLARLEQLLDDATAAARELNLFARRGATTMPEKPLELRRLLETLLPMLRLMVPKTVQMMLEPPVRDAWVSANAVALQQVVVNLVQNARDALAEKPDGTIALRCELVANGQAVNPAAPHLSGMECVRIAVTDNGPGIEPALLDRIFEPFFTTKGARGSGLGLAMAKETVRRHAGALRAISRPGAGATFELLLPLAPPDGEARRGATATFPAPGVESTPLAEPGGPGR